MFTSAFAILSTSQGTGGSIHDIFLTHLFIFCSRSKKSFFHEPLLSLWRTSRHPLHKMKKTNQKRRKILSTFFLFLLLRMERTEPLPALRDASAECGESGETWTVYTQIILYIHIIALHLYPLYLHACSYSYRPIPCIWCPFVHFKLCVFYF